MRSCVYVYNTTLRGQGFWWGLITTTMIPITVTVIFFVFFDLFLYILLRRGRGKGRDGTERNGKGREGDVEGEGVVVTRLHRDTSYSPRQQL
jgi:membrane protein implicated in regulation of membrane protease activity